MKRLWIFGILVVLLITAGGYFAYNHFSQDKVYEGIPAANAIPHNTPLVFIIDDLKDLSNSLHKGNLSKGLETMPLFTPIYKLFEELDAKMAANKQLQSILYDKKITIAVNFSGKNSYQNLYLMALDNDEELSVLKNELSQYAGAHGFKISQRAYEHNTIFDVNGKKGKDEFSFALSRGVMIVSEDATLVEDAIRQLGEGTLQKDKYFNKLYRIAGDGCAVSMFLNHGAFARLQSYFMNHEYKKGIASFTDYGEWSGLDLVIKDKSFSMNGFSLAGDSVKNMLSIFGNQKPITSDVEDILPAHTAWYAGLSLSDFEVFSEDFDRFTKGKSSYFKRLEGFERMKRSTNLDLLSFLKENIENDVAMAFTDLEEEMPERFGYFVIEMKSRSQAKEKFEEFLNRYASRQKKPEYAKVMKYNLDKETSFDIYKFPFEDFPRYLLGDFFSPVKARYFTFVENYMIFGSSFKDLCKFHHSNVLNETLRRDITFNKFADNLTQRGSFSLFVNINRSISLLKRMLAPEVFDLLVKNEEILRNFGALGLRFGCEDRMVFNYAYLNYDEEKKNEPQTVWRHRLDTVSNFKPVFVMNHRDRKNKECMIQDQKHNLYLLSKDGRKVWKKTLSEPIMGSVHQIDYYRNGKLQYLFNTKSKLYLIDRNGNNVAKYPIRLRSKATNPVAVFDYDKNRNYRFFIAGEDQKIYAYQKDGNLVSGWKKFKTEHQVAQPVQFHRISGKDFIVAADTRKTYLLDRRGSVRVKTSDVFDHCPQNELILDKGKSLADTRLVTTDVDGKVHSQYFDGKSKTDEVIDCEKDHSFSFEDVNGDGKKDFIFLDEDELNCYTQSGKKLFDYEFDQAIISPINCYTFSGGKKKIGICSAKENKIYLINNDGSLYNGFPLNGSSSFSIGFLSAGNSHFNLIVGNEDGYLLNYLVE
ncbi:hypothetical protein EYV94_24330 [Puteibacter caeruleilacunae]|nr:hypothetical protein EYV94_24330 [Puteibacter caeruleilacunae]